MWKPVEEFRRASGPLWVVLLVSVGGSLGAAGLLWLFGQLTTQGWAIISVAVVLALLVATLRAWYREWKRAEKALEDSATWSQLAREAGGQLHDAEESRLALRVIAEYLWMAQQGQTDQQIATRLLPFSHKLWQRVPAERRYEERVSPVGRAYTTIANIHNHRSGPLALVDAVHALAAEYDLPHLIPAPPADPQRSKSSS